MDNQIGKETALKLFREALSIAAERIEEDMCARVPKAPVTREEHERGVARIMAAYRSYAARRLKNRILIGLLAAVLIVLTSCTIYVNRDKIASFVERIYSTHVDLSYDDIDENVPATIEVEYTLAYIPEGYELVEKHSTSLRTRTEWGNLQGERITFLQSVLTGDWIGLDREESDLETKRIKDKLIYLSQHSGNCTYLWNDGSYSYKLTITEKFTEDDLEKLLDLKPTETE